MAKKIPKKKRIEPNDSVPGPSSRRLFVILLVPWIILGIGFVVLAATDLPDYAVILISLLISLVVTFFLGNYVRSLRLKQRKKQSH